LWGEVCYCKRMLVWLYQEAVKLAKSIFEAIKERRSNREFRSDPVPYDTIRQIVEYGLKAPSAGNMQPWGLIIVKEPEIKARLAKAAFGQKFVSDAPVVVVILADPKRSAARYGDRGSMLYCIQDTAACIQNMLLASVGFGLCTCWVGSFDEQDVASILNLPGHLRPVAMVPIGYPMESNLPRGSRKDRPWDEVVKIIE